MNANQSAPGDTHKYFVCKCHLQDKHKVTCHFINRNLQLDPMWIKDLGQIKKQGRMALVLS